MLALGMEMLCPQLPEQQLPLCAPPIPPPSPEPHTSAALGAQSLAVASAQLALPPVSEPITATMEVEVVEVSPKAGAPPKEPSPHCNPSSNPTITVGS
jgi:hypothetical protein